MQRNDAQKVRLIENDVKATDVNADATAYFVGLSYLVQMTKKRQSGSNITSVVRL